MFTCRLYTNDLTMTLLIISFDFQLPSMKAIHVLLGKVTKTLTVGCNYLKTAKLKRTFNNNKNAILKNLKKTTIGT